MSQRDGGHVDKKAKLSISLDDFTFSYDLARCLRNMVDSKDGAQSIMQVTNIYTGSNNNNNNNVSQQEEKKFMYFYCADSVTAARVIIFKPRGDLPAIEGNDVISVYGGLKLGTANFTQNTAKKVKYYIQTHNLELQLQDGFSISKDKRDILMTLTSVYSSPEYARIHCIAKLVNMPFQVAGKVHLEIEDADGTQMVVFLQGSAATKVVRLTLEDLKEFDGTTSKTVYVLLWHACVRYDFGELPIALSITPEHHKYADVEVFCPDQENQYEQAERLFTEHQGLLEEHATWRPDASKGETVATDQKRKGKSDPIDSKDSKESGYSKEDISTLLGLSNQDDTVKEAESSIAPQLIPEGSSEAPPQPYPYPYPPPVDPTFQKTVLAELTSIKATLKQISMDVTVVKQKQTTLDDALGAAIRERKQQTTAKQPARTTTTTTQPSSASPPASNNAPSFPYPYPPSYGYPYGYPPPPK